ncbi:hypothetical protein JOM56_012619 [Amanita muscaria]
MTKPPPSLPPTTGAPLKVTLLIGTPDYFPLSADLFDLYVPPSQPAPVHPEEVLPSPPRNPTYIPSRTKTSTAFFALAVLASWTVLLNLHLLSPRIFPFVATLTAFEELLFWYWIALRLGDVWLYGTILVFSQGNKHLLASQVIYVYLIGITYAKSSLP